VGEVVNKSFSFFSRPVNYLLMQPPTRAEINVHESLDEQTACEHFLGKNLEEAEAMFCEGPMCYGEDLMWMGPVAFRYYVHAAIRYLKNLAGAGKSDFIRSFAAALEHRLKYEPEELGTIAAELADICSYILENYGELGDLPKTKEEWEAMKSFMDKQFEEFGRTLGETFTANVHKTEDYIDLRPRFKLLESAFLALAAR
jgi:hypothetical protein